MRANFHCADHPSELYTSLAVQEALNVSAECTITHYTLLLYSLRLWIYYDKVIGKASVFMDYPCGPRMRSPFVR